MLDQNNRPQKWEVLESKTRVKDKFINVRTDKCRATNGDILDYHVLSYTDWVNVIPFDAQTQELILVDEYRHGIGEPVLGLAGGAVDKEDGLSAEQAARAAALRELKEETGHRVDAAQLVLKSMTNPATHNNWVYSYLAFNAVDEGETAFDPGDGEFCITVKRDFVHVLEAISSGELQVQAMHVAALWSAAKYILKAENLPGEFDPLRARIKAFLLG